MSAQVRPGFKLTEIGAIPEDWELSELSAVSMTSSGTTPARSLADRYYRNGTINWVKTLDLNNSEIADTDELVTQAALEETCLRVYPEGTVLVAMYGGFNQIGRTGVLRIPAAVNQAITAIQTKSALHPEYLLATLNYRVDYWKSVASSSRKDPNITSQDVRSFKISFPPIKEQRAIATALSSMDALISGLDQLIAKKRDIKQASTQQLLTGQQRLQGFSGAWEMKRVGDIFDIFAGGDFEPSNSSPIQDEKHPFPIFSNSVTDAGLYGYCSYSIYPKNSITVTARGAVGFANYRDTPYTAIGRVLVLQPKIEINCPFYAEFINNKITFVVESTGVPQLTAPQISKYEIPIPSCAEQAAIANILFDMDSELTALETRRYKARQFKKGMMQELLTGRIRLL